MKNVQVVSGSGGRRLNGSHFETHPSDCLLNYTHSRSLPTVITNWSA